MKTRQPFTNSQVIDLVNVGFISLAGLFVSGREKLEELLQVTLVITQSVRADVALVTQVIEELSAKLIEHTQSLGVVDGMNSDKNRFFGRQTVVDCVSQTINILAEAQSVSLQFKGNISKKDANFVR